MGEREGREGDCREGSEGGIGGGSRIITGTSASPSKKDKFAEKKIASACSVTNYKAH